MQLIRRSGFPVLRTVCIPSKAVCQICGHGMMSDVKVLIAEDKRAAVQVSAPEATANDDAESTN